ncbi:MAG TPA: bifunctional [glutamate--ammonia ligase]-adenylyl-L-tyrosine phosphorylase/[glutamate--ammonia-ligase] adenylyltransferase [Steroidobacteraceae bacterium]
MVTRSPLVPPGDLPPELRSAVKLALGAITENPAAIAALERAPPAVRDSLQRVLACSDFIAGSCTRHANFLPSLLEGGSLTMARPPGALAATLRQAGTGAFDEAAVMKLLRENRRRESVRIAWRDLAGWSSVEESLRDLSELADESLVVAQDFAWQALVARHGTPRSVAGEAQPLVVIGMGKLGGGELNFSSDIDLVLLFPEGGETDGRRSVSNEEFFARLARQLIRLLDAVTPDGFVFRVDLRLRPFGESGPLVASFASFENYLQQHGRDWERYAYVKARALTSADHYETLYRDAVRPFVYRRYLDFGVFESLREMKDLIAREVARRELENNIKLGPGGIREVEFIVQAFQLLRGGNDQRLQSPSLLSVLPRLAGQKLLPAQTIEQLKSAYLYLRRLENRIQMMNDEQTHTLPDDAFNRARLVLAMSARDWAELTAELDRHRDIVTRHFQTVIFAPAIATPGALPALDLEALRDGEQLEASLRHAVTTLGLEPAGEIVQLLAQWRSSGAVQRLDDIGRRRLQTLIPRSLAGLRGVAMPAVALRRVLRVLEAVGTRSTYFALLNENATALARLIAICERSAFLTTQIAVFPLLLDELIDERILDELPTREQFAQELAARLSHVPESDPERQVEALRQFQRAATFRVALADLTGRLPLMQVSDRLTDIAELILEQALNLAWQQMAQLHGVPMCGSADGLRPAGVAAIGYGKLGGTELGYASDLDLVFLHDSAGEVQRTDGGRPLDNGVFFLRLGQRIVHLLTMHSAAGRLYEVDMRLRPSGKGGLMVTQIDAFHSYQRTEAWTWEHQALLRSRAVAGEIRIRRRFEDVRLDVLCHHVRRESLRDEVRRMRERMRAELSKAREGQFDIKQDPGGIADIEFLAQYWALRWAEEYPPLVMFSDTIRQLESVASVNLVPQATVDVLTRNYREYRSVIHHRSLESETAVVDAQAFTLQREQVLSIWNAALVAS